MCLARVRCSWESHWHPFVLVCSCWCRKYCQWSILLFHWNLKEARNEIDIGEKFPRSILSEIFGRIYISLIDTAFHWRKSIVNLHVLSLFLVKTIGLGTGFLDYSLPLEFLHVFFHFFLLGQWNPARSSFLGMRFQYECQWSIPFVPSIFNNRSIIRLMVPSDWSYCYAASLSLRLPITIIFSRVRLWTFTFMPSAGKNYHKGRSKNRNN